MIEKSSKDKILIIAFPSEGLVRVFATYYIVNQMKMNNVSELEFFEISLSYLIKDGEVHGLCQIYNSDNIYAILACIPLNSVSACYLVKKSEELSTN